MKNLLSQIDSIKSNWIEFLARSDLLIKNQYLIIFNHYFFSHLNMNIMNPYDFIDFHHQNINDEIVKYKLKKARRQDNAQKATFMILWFFIFLTLVIAMAAQNQS